MWLNNVCILGILPKYTDFHTKADSPEYLLKRDLVPLLNISINILFWRVRLSSGDLLNEFGADGLPSSPARKRKSNCRMAL